MNRDHGSFACGGHGQEMNTLRQELADRTVEESEGREKLRELEDKVSNAICSPTVGRPKRLQELTRYLNSNVVILLLRSPK